ncbi:RNA-binding cell elongation regulator Jag/EloR [Bacillus pumilus]|uniref:RNA-binding cell elongation regulator Jag/EloR n=1 Tax=Bacillus pumilus TaxID=1408 RepID=UPI00248F7AA1|nr:RNA-binding cell elongation regulator Jag/EloR [Bacillus pumilus]
MKEMTAVGRTIEEAVDSGLKQIQLLKEEVDITILDEGNKGFLGLFGKRQAVVKLIEKRNALKLATQYLDNIVKFIDPKAKTVSKQEPKKISFHIDGDKTSLMIGKRGQTLYSLETLVQLVFNRYSDQYHHITIDIGDYRKKRQEALEQYAVKTANKVLKTKRKVHLEPMPSNERKVIHDTIATFSKELATASEDTGSKRHVVVLYKK